MTSEERQKLLRDASRKLDRAIIHSNDPQADTNCSIAASLLVIADCLANGSGTSWQEQQTEAYKYTGKKRGKQ